MRKCLLLYLSIIIFSCNHSSKKSFVKFPDKERVKNFLGRYYLKKDFDGVRLFKNVDIISMRRIGDSSIRVFAIVYGYEHVFSKDGQDFLDSIPLKEEYKIDLQYSADSSWRIMPTHKKTVINVDLR